MPAVWAAWFAGDLDQYQVWKIDKVDLSLVRSESVTALDEEVVVYATTHTTAQLGAWLNRFVPKAEADHFNQRFTRALKDRCVSVSHDPDAIAWVNGLSSVDTSKIDALLT